MTVIQLNHFKHPLNHMTDQQICDIAVAAYKGFVEGIESKRPHYMYTEDLLKVIKLGMGMICEIDPVEDYDEGK